MNFSHYLCSLFLGFFSFNVQANSCEKVFKNQESTAFYSKKFIQDHYTKNFKPSILRTGDIRGVFLKDFDFGFVELLATALSQYFKEKTLSQNPHILVAHDARIPASSLSYLLIEKLSKKGILIDKLGLIPTPLAYHFLSASSRDAAVVITASHNPKKYMGFKTVLNPKYNITNAAPEINKIILENSKKQSKKELSNIEIKAQPQDKSLSAENSYIESLKKEFKSLKFDSFVLDTSNGASGPIAKKTFEAFNLKPHYINLQPNGSFPNHDPDPTKQSNLQQLQQKVKETKSEFGIAFDGDGDRIVITHSDGKIIEPDQYTYLFLPELAVAKKSNSIVIDIKISSWFINKAKEMGFDIIMTKTGYYFIKEEMKVNKSIMAIEESAHIMFNDRKDRGHDDGIYNALRFIELIDKRGLEYVKNKLNEVKHYTTKEFILQNTNKEKEQKTLVDKLKKYLEEKKEKPLTIDGVRVDRDKAWAVFRFSNTEDIGTITIQAPTEKETLSIAQEFSQVLGKSLIQK